MHQEDQKLYTSPAGEGPKRTLPGGPARHHKLRDPQHKHLDLQKTPGRAGDTGLVRRLPQTPSLPN